MSLRGACAEEAWNPVLRRRWGKALKHAPTAHPKAFCAELRLSGSSRSWSLSRAKSRRFIMSSVIGGSSFGLMSQPNPIAIHR